MDVPLFGWWTRQRSGKGGARSRRYASEEARDRVDQEADQPADQRPVDAHKLQISSYRQLEAPRGRRRIPARHRLSNQVADLVPILFDDARRQVDQQVVDLGEECGVREQRDPEFGETTVERIRTAIRGGSTVRACGVLAHRLTHAVPQLPGRLVGLRSHEPLFLPALGPTNA